MREKARKVARGAALRMTGQGVFVEGCEDVASRNHEAGDLIAEIAARSWCIMAPDRTFPTPTRTA